MKKHALAMALAVTLSGLLAACGGGGGSEAPPAPPAATAIPESLAITSPASADSGTAVKFGNSVGAFTGLKYGWDFGDGSTSADAAPSHSYANGGEFEVVLKVTNEVGASRETRSKVSITNIANVRGLVCSGADSKGWCWQNPRPSGNRVNATFFLNGSLGWRVGEAGEIFKTTDGGATWLRLNSGISTALSGIAFFDAQSGWATGPFGAILRTTDGGTTWTVDKIGDSATSNYDVSVITPVTASTVYVGRADTSNSGTSYGTVLASSDGGTSWRQLSPPPVAITSTGKLWSLQSSVLKRSVDGGKTFTTALELNKAGDPYFYFDSISFAARDDLGAALLTTQSSYDQAAQKYVSTYTVRSTLDGGSTWTATDSPGLATLGNGVRLLNVSADGLVLTASAYASGALLRSTDRGQHWTALGAVDANQNGFNFTALGGDVYSAISYAGIYISEDGGQTWPALKLPANVSVYALAGSPLRRLAATTYSLTEAAGNVHLTRDAGESWTKVVASNSDGYYYYGASLAVAFRDARNGFMVDEKGRSLATQDGGANWVLKRADFGNVTSLQFVSKQVGWLIGSDGRLYKSTDGGESWLTGPVASGTTYSAIQFENETTGWARRYSPPTGSGIVVTQDGGQTWRDVNLVAYNLTSLRLGTGAWVAAGSSGEVLVSRDSGASWKSVFTGTGALLNAVAFSDAKTCWVVGADGVLLRSDDSGATWTPLRLASSALRDIKFANAKVGWIVGENGVILATADGGKTWRPQASGTTVALTSLQIVDANTAWISGVGGTLLATGNGGN